MEKAFGNGWMAIRTSSSCSLNSRTLRKFNSDEYFNHDLKQYVHSDIISHTKERYRRKSNPSCMRYRRMLRRLQLLSKIKNLVAYKNTVIDDGYI